MRSRSNHGTEQSCELQHFLEASMAPPVDNEDDVSVAIRVRILF